jgi:hypothetical protein
MNCKGQGQSISVQPAVWWGERVDRRHGTKKQKDKGRKNR